MCYSAQIIADYRRYVREYGATIDLTAFYDLFWRRAKGAVPPKVPKAVEEWFTTMDGDPARGIRDLISERRAAEATRVEQELFVQRKRLADAGRTLQTKTTKAAQESQRIATNKVEAALARLASLRSADLAPDDLRIFPGYWTPVIVMEAGRRVVKPMRYQCRPAGAPAFYDKKFPGTYNARRDSLGGFWRNLFGQSHGLILATAFYENVRREDGSNVVLEFKPHPATDMLVACLWSRWTAPGEPDLLSCAAITDEPPAEVAAAGHDRCIIPIEPRNIDAWLAPRAGDLDSLQAVLDDRARPYYEHRLAA